MPIVNVNRSDAALASSASGALAVSQGPGAIPVFDSNNSWDPANRQRKLIGHAVGVSGDRWSCETNLGLALAKFDNSGTLVHDLSVNSSGIATAITSGGNPPPFTFNRAVGSFANTGGNAYDNAVWQDGWNTGSGGNPINLLYPTFRIALESNFWTGNEQWMEGHWAAYTAPGGGGETRPYSVVVNKSNNYDTYGIFQGSSWVYANRGQTIQISSLVRDSSENVFWTVQGKGNQNGTDGYSLRLVSGASPVSDVMTLGRNTAAGSTFVLNSSSQTAINLNGGAGRALIGAGATILTFQAPASGGFLQERTDNYQLLNHAANRFLVRAGDNGTAAQIGFLGAAPSSRLTFGAATAGDTWTAAEKAMLQKVYDGMRTFGFGT